MAKYSEHKGILCINECCNYELDFVEIEELYAALENDEYPILMRKSPLSPRGNEVYVYKLQRNNDRDHLHDNYRMTNKGIYINKEGTFKKTYYYTQLTNDRRSKTSKDFYKITYYKIRSELVIIHYLGDHRKGVINLPLSGLKIRRSYISRPSVLAHIKKTDMKESPMKEFTEVHDQENSQHQRHSSDAQQIKKKVKNASGSKGVKTNISRGEAYSLMEMGKQDFNDCILEFQILPSVRVVIAHPEAIKLAKKLLISSKEDSTIEQLILYETKFNIGEFYVSIVVMRNTDFEEESIFPVFFLIHESTDESAHKLLWQNYVDEILELSLYMENTPVMIVREKAIYQAIARNPVLGRNIVFCLNHILDDICEYFTESHGNADDIAVIKEQIVNLCYADNFNDRLTTYITTWSDSFVKYFERNIKDDLYNKCSKEQISRFAVFKTKSPTNSISESMKKLVEGHVNNKELPLDSIVLALYQFQLYFLYEYRKGYAEHGNYATKSTSYKSVNINLTDVEFIQVEDILKSILDRTWEPKKLVEKIDTFRLTQTEIARKVVRCKLITFESDYQVWLVKSPYNKKYYTIHCSKRGLVCSCSSRKRCYHIMSVELFSNKNKSCTKQYKLSGLKKRAIKGRELSFHSAPDSIENLSLSFSRGISSPGMSKNFSTPIKSKIQNEPKQDLVCLDNSPKEILLVHDDLEEERWLEGGTIDKAILKLIYKHEKRNQVLYVDSMTYTLFARKNILPLLEYLHQFDAYNKDAIIICINTDVDLGEHWILGVILLNTSTVAIFDSIHDNNCRKNEMINLVKMTQIAAMIAGIEIEISKWRFLYSSEDQQRNGFDCGIFVIKNAHKLLTSERNDEIGENMRNWVKSLMSDLHETQTWNRKKKIPPAIVQYIKINIWKFLNVRVETVYGLIEIVRMSLNKYNEEWTFCSYENCRRDPQHSQEQNFCIGCRNWFHEKCVTGTKKNNYFSCWRCVKEF